MNIDVFDGFEDDSDDAPPPAVVPPPLPFRFRPMSWGSLILEMLMTPESADEILAVHNTTVEEVQGLINSNPEFQAAMRECKSRVKAHGTSSGFVLRSQMIAEELLPRMYQLAISPTTPVAMQMRAIENAVDWARLNPKNDKGRTDATDTGVHVSINMIGLKDMPQIVSVESTAEDKK